MGIGKDRGKTLGVHDLTCTCTPEGYIPLGGYPVVGQEECYMKVHPHEVVAQRLPPHSLHTAGMVVAQHLCWQLHTNSAAVGSSLGPTGGLDGTDKIVAWVPAWARGPEWGWWWGQGGWCCCATTHYKQIWHKYSQSQNPSEKKVHGFLTMLW